MAEGLKHKRYEERFIQLGGEQAEDLTAFCSYLKEGVEKTDGLVEVQNIRMKGNW